MWFVSLLVLIFMLGIIILVHEFGHFYWAKKFGVHIYEFSIGMGPKIYTHKGKDKIDYNFRAIPIGGFVAMAGEVYDDNEKIPKNKLLCHKKWWQRLIILAAGVINNFILALILLFISSLIWGGKVITPVIQEVVQDTPMAKAGIKSGAEIIAVDNHKFSSWEVFQIRLYLKSKDGAHILTIKDKDNQVKAYKIKPQMVKQETGEEIPVFGFVPQIKVNKGILSSLKYAFLKFDSTIRSMCLTIAKLISGKLSVKYLSGPVGIYEAVNVTVSIGIESVISLLILLSINVGFINILPFPAFDGGHILFLLIEKIKGSPVNPKIENIIHTIGFGFLILLMIYITIKDIIKLF